MELWHWVVLFFGIFLVIGIINNLVNPPKEIEWTEVPEEFRQLFETSFPGFEVLSVKHVPAAREYKVKGSYRTREARVELEYGTKDKLQEIEYEDSRAGVGVTGSEKCQLSDLTTDAMSHFGDLLGSERESFQQALVVKGSFLNQPAFKIKGASQNWRWDVEIAGDGTLVELEKTLI